MKVLLCAIAKNENNYIREWVEHYFKLGFDHIVLYDNNDVDGERFEEVIDDYIQANFVEVINVRGLSRQQIPRYDECYQTRSNEYDWIAFFDIDEFLELDSNNIHLFLENQIYAKFDCIVVSWKTFDDSNLIKTGGNYSISRFKTYPKPEKQMTKRIIRTKLPIIINSPHGAIDRCGENHDKYTSCNSDGQPTKAHIQIANGSWINARLNHFRYKTLEEFITNKMKRGYPTWWLNDGKDLGFDQFFSVNEITLEKLEYIMHKLGISFNKLETMLKKDLSEFKKQWQKKAHTLFYWKDKINVGDVYGKWLLENIGIHVDYSNTNPELAACGSILQATALNKNTKVFGCGLHNADSIAKPDISNIFGVRGKLTLELLGQTNNKDIVLGDSGLLLSSFYKPKFTHKYRFGLVCHWRDLAFFEEKYKDTSVHVISTKTSDIEEFADQLAECDFIFSSSLHGIIFSHSLGIPAAHLEKNMLESKDNFKFKDYYSVLDIAYSKIEYSEQFDFNSFLDSIEYNKYVPDKKHLFRIKKLLYEKLIFLKNNLLYVQAGLHMPANNTNIINNINNNNIINNNTINNSNNIDIIIYFINNIRDINYNIYCKTSFLEKDILRKSYSEEYFKRFISKVKQIKNIRNIYLIVPSLEHSPKDITVFKKIYTQAELLQTNLLDNNQNIIDFYLTNIDDLSENFLYFKLDEYETKFLPSALDYFNEKNLISVNDNYLSKNLAALQVLTNKNINNNLGYVSIGLNKTIYNKIILALNTLITKTKTPIPNINSIDRKLFGYYFKFAKLLDIKNC